MAFCPNCGKEIPEGQVFCSNCGASLNAPGAQPAAPAVDPYDHTADFSPEDISQNKVIAMAAYLLGAVGVIIALLAAPQSPYASFHVRQALKFTMVEVLLLIVSAVLVWTFIVPIAAAICVGVLGVIEIICFFQVCQGKAKDAPIIRSLGFLK